MARVIRLHEDDGAFDREFWAGMPPARRLELAWDLVLEYLAWRCPDAGEPDFKDLFAALNAEEAERLIVDWHARAVHAAPRFRLDLGVWVNSAGDDPPRVRAALQRFGAPLAEPGPADLATPGIVFQIGVEPNRIDVLTANDGMSIPEAWAARAETRSGGELVHVIGRRHLPQDKRASSRPQDLIDADVLERGGSPG
jgi:hypothetical protein